MICMSTFDLQYCSKISLLTLFCSLQFCTYCAHSSFIMSLNPGMVVPFGSKNLGQFVQEYSHGKWDLTAILKAVETVGAPKFTGRKQGISCCHISAFLWMLIFLTLFTASSSQRTKRLLFSFKVLGNISIVLICYW
jgi:hypothetical protein